MGLETPQQIQLKSKMDIEIVSYFEKCNYGNVAVQLKQYMRKKGILLFWADPDHIFMVKNISQDKFDPLFMDANPLHAMHKFFIRTVLQYHDPEINLRSNILIKIGKQNAQAVYPEFEDYLYYPSQVA